MIFDRNGERRASQIVDRGHLRGGGRGMNTFIKSRLLVQRQGAYVRLIRLHPCRHVIRCILLLEAKVTGQPNCSTACSVLRLTYRHLEVWGLQTVRPADNGIRYVNLVSYGSWAFQCRGECLHSGHLTRYSNRQHTSFFMVVVLADLAEGRLASWEPNL